MMEEIKCATQNIKDLNLRIRHKNICNYATNITRLQKINTSIEIQDIINNINY